MICWRYRSSMDASRKNGARLLQPRGQRVDFLERGVQVKGSPGGGREPQFCMKRHRAMMPGADGDPEGIENLCDVMRMNAFQREGDHPTPLGGFRSENRHAGYLPQGFHRIPRDG